MSSKAIRNARRLLEEERARQAKNGDQAPSDEEELDDASLEPAQAKKSLFALLNANDDDDDDDEEEEEDEDESRRNYLERDKSKLNQPTSTGAASNARRKKKKKKKNAKAKNALNTEEPDKSESDLDEIDRALRSLNATAATSSQGDGQSNTGATGTKPAYDELCRLLSVDSIFLHASNEMRRLFGRVATTEDGEGGDDGPNRPRRGATRGLGRGAHQNSGLSGLSLRRNVFVQGKEDWPPAAGSGLGMEVLERCQDGIVNYGYVRGGGYNDAQLHFEEAKRNMDPEGLVGLLRIYPYHPSTLMLVSQLASHQLQHADSTTLLERALFALGRAAHSTFPRAIATGTARLPFRHRENRDLFHIAARYAFFTPTAPNAAANAAETSVGGSLGQRALFRTAYEWAKLILSLDPERDPYCIRLYLDVLALRAREGSTYRAIATSAFLGAWWSGKDYAPETLSSRPSDTSPAAAGATSVPLPNVLYSLALTYLPGSPERAQESLLHAMRTVPFTARRLYQSLDLEPVPRSVWGREATSRLEELLTELYVRRGGAALWREEGATRLLKRCGEMLDEETKTEKKMSGEEEQQQQQQEQQQDMIPSRDVVRFVRLLEDPVLVGLLDLRGLNEEEGGGEMDYSDPLPPLDST